MINEQTNRRCACGCGGLVAQAKPHRPQARYIFGHQARDNSNARGKSKGVRTRCGKQGKAENYGDIRSALKRHEAGQKAEGRRLEAVSYCSVGGR